MSDRERLKFSSQDRSPKPGQPLQDTYKSGEGTIILDHGRDCWLLGAKGVSRSF